MSQTTIKYNFSVTSDILTNIQKSGIADLSPHFFLGAESDEIDSNGISYLSVEYWDPSDSFLTSIRVGIDPENEKILLAKIICTIEPFKIDLDNCPTLIENK